jgi:two-component system cell cycle sensor histidine kinase/response regulator CckA
MTVQHSLLKRQLKRIYGDLERVPIELMPLVEAVDRAYQEADDDRRTLERSLDISSQELMQVNEQLRRGYADLERRMHEERDRFFALSVDLISVVGFDGHFKLLNPAWERTLGWSLDELLARPFIDFVHPDDRTATLGEWHRVRHGATALTFENRYRCKDGSYRWLQWNSIPSLDEQVTYATARDITDRRRLEDQLRQSQKMEAVGRLAGGIAHDFNNLLTVITGYSEFLQGQLAAGSPQWDVMEQIKAASGRAASLTKQLLAFSRRQVLQPTVLDLNAVIENLQQMLKRLISEQVKLVTKLQPRLGLVRVDPGQLDQVIINLAVNARDAMPDGGRLVIETANARFDRAYTAQHFDIQEGSYVMLAVSDTGSGMDHDTQLRIFEPFFTTKEGGKGTGLGLATVYGIVKQSGGHLSVYSEVGHGSSFRLYLPMLSDAAIAAAAPEESAVRARSGETILLVEDDESVRRLARVVLEEHGYRVMAVSTCAEAIARSERHEGMIDLLLTDVVVPDGSGRSIAEQICAQRKDLKVLYMSGHTDDTVIHHGVVESGAAFIHKPFTTAALTRKVRETIDSAAKTGRAGR